MVRVLKLNRNDAAVVAQLHPFFESDRKSGRVDQAGHGPKPWLFEVTRAHAPTIDQLLSSSYLLALESSGDPWLHACGQWLRQGYDLYLAWCRHQCTTPAHLIVCRTKTSTNSLHRKGAPTNRSSGLWWPKLRLWCGRSSRLTHRTRRTRTSCLWSHSRASTSPPNALWSIHHSTRLPVTHSKRSMF